MALTVLLAGQVPLVASSAPGTSEFPSSDRGLMVFEAYCVGCHGLNGKGDGPMAAPLLRDFGVRPTDLSAQGYLAKRSDAELTAAITGGGKAVHRTAYMPAWGATLKPDQVGDLVAYIRELQEGGQPEQPSFANIGKQLELGRVLYSIQCAACHGPQGEGDGPFIEGLTTGEGAVLGVEPPSLAAAGFFRERSDADITTLIQQKPHHSGLKPGQSEWWNRQLQPEEVESLIFYLRTLPMNREEARS